MDLFHQLDIENQPKLCSNDNFTTDQPAELLEEKKSFIEKLEDAFFEEKNDPLISIQDNITLDDDMLKCPQQVLEKNDKKTPKSNCSRGGFDHPLIWVENYIIFEFLLSFLKVCNQ